MSIVFGKGGGGKKNASNSADDNLQSHARARIIDAISEGPIVGLVDGANSVFINKTPLSNIEDSTYQIRLGNPDDQPVNGFPGVEGYQSVGVVVSQTVGPQIRTVLDTDTDVVRIYMNLGNLYKINKKGALKTTDGGWNIDVRPAGGNWTRAVTFELNGRKSTSAVQFQHDLRIGEYGSGPWDIRLTARYGDRTEDKIYETINWEGYSLVTEAKLIYPHTAHVALNLDSEHVGTSVPTRHYHIYGRRVQVPSNYDPTTRTYTGVWNGTFKIAWTNNPAWMFYDIVTNNRFGIGNEVPASVANKWQLYTIAQYCDQLVPSGYKNASGGDIMEPRYTFNGVILDKKKALDALRSMTAVWRGMGFYTQSQFFVTSDMVQDVAHIYGPSNVLDGRFEYSNSSAGSRHSVVQVRFNDANNFFEPAIEPVIDNEMVHNLGWLEKTVELTGCSSRSLARRYGRWIIDSEKNEVETVTFSVGMDSIHALPGEIIAINDPRRAEVRMSGRIESVVNGNTIRFDQALDSAINRTGATIYIHKPDGTIFKRTVTIAANFLQVGVGTGNATDDMVGCNYVISAVNVAPREYRIVSLDEDSPGHSCKITALQYDRNKFARIEQGIVFDPLPVRVDKSKVNTVRNLTAQSQSYTDGGSVRTDITLNWQPPEDTLVRRYEVYVDTPTASNVHVGPTLMNSISYSTTDPGEYSFRVFTVNIAGNRSAAATVPVVVNGTTDINVGVVEGLVNAVTGLTTGGFTGPDCRIRWRNMMTVSTDPTVPRVEEDSALYAGSTVKVFSGTTLLREQNLIGNTYTYTLEMNRTDAASKGFASARRSLRFEVTLTDKEGRVSLPSELSLANPAPAAPVIRASSAGTIINLDWEPVSDRDLEGYLVWIETNSGFVPSATTPRRRLKSDQMTWTGAPAQEYFVAIAAYDAFGEDMLNYSSKISISTGLNPFDDVAPAIPTGLSLSSTTDSLTASWNANSENDLSHYDIEVTERAGNAVSFTTTTNSYVWRGTKPNTQFSVRVRAVDRNGNRSNWTTAVVHTTASDTVPPAVPTGISVTAGFGTLWVRWTANLESDFSHYEIYQSNTTTAPAVGATATYTTAASAVTVTGLGEAVTRHFWVRAVDTSGNKSAWSARYPGTTSSIWTHVTDPAVPTGLAVNSALDGAQARNAATWATATNCVSYELGITETGNTEVVFAASELRYEWLSRPAKTFSVRVRGVNAVGRKSAWSSAVPLTAAADTVAPAVPAGLTVTPAFKGFWLQWTTNTETDLSHYEVIWNTASWTPAANAVASLSTLSAKVSIGGMADNVAMFFRIRAVDTSGNKSPWSAEVSATTLSGVDVSITSEDIAGLVDATSFASGIEPVSIINAGPLPTVKSTTAIVWGGKLYRWNGTAYTASTAVTDLDGQIIGSQISAGAVGTQQLAFGAATGSKLAIGDFTNLVPDSDLIDPAAWTLPATVTLDTANHALVYAVSTAAQAPASMRFQVEPGAEYFFAATVETVNASAVGNFRLQLRWMNQAGGWISWTPNNDVPLPQNGSITIERSAIAPLNAAYAVLFLSSPANASANAVVTVKKPIVRMKNSGKLIVDGTLKSNHFVTNEAVITGTAQIANAIITNAHITDMNAGKLIAGSALAGSITVAGTALSTIQGQAANPAATLNAGSTMIDPGRIRILGTTALSSWINGTNSTEINGGAIAANTISANRLNIGLRGIQPNNIQFEANADGVANRVRWNSGVKVSGSFDNTGTIFYVDNAGANLSRTITGNFATWTAGILYIYWVQGATTLSTTTNVATARGANNVIIATYKGGLALNANFGKTVIDGDEIRTGTIRASNLIQTEAVITNQAQVGNATIRNAAIVELDAGKITAGTTLSGSVLVDGRALSVLGGDTLLDTIEAPWTKFGPGAGTVTHASINETGATGTRAMRANGDGEVRIYSPNKIPFDPRKLYKISFDIRKMTGATMTKGQFVGGVRCLDGDNAVVLDRFDAGIEQSTIPYSFTRYSFYIKGAASAQSGTGSLLNPRVLLDTTRYLTPICTFNYVETTSDGNYRMLLNTATIEVVDEDAADVVNAGSTLIEPGKIRVSGSTTLSDWKKGGDETRIDGGMLSANTVRANSLEIGSRNVTLTGIQFEHNRPSANSVYWSAGAIRWINDAGVDTATAISSGSVLWTSGVIYIYWVKGAASLSTTSSQTTAFGVNNLILATYQGGKLLDADFGRTVIDGSDLKTGTVTADRVDTTTFSASGLALFGGTLQSNNFNAANGTGWRIQNNGTMNMPAASIGRAQIADLAVDTINIRDSAITMAAYTTMNGSAVSYNQTQQVASFTFPGPGGPGRALMRVRGYNFNRADSSATAFAELRLNGLAIGRMEKGVFTPGQPESDITSYYEMNIRSILAGTNTVTLWHKNTPSPGSQWELDILYFKK